MGRGRQKAKHTRAARELKYNVPKTDYAALQRELAGNSRLEEDLDKWSEYTTEPKPSSETASSDGAKPEQAAPDPAASAADDAAEHPDEHDAASDH